jgi:hypothetical protein
MFTSLKEIERWIKQRLTDENHMLSSMREVVGQLCNRNQLKSLLTALLNDEEKLCQSSLYSYKHSNGFDRIIILSPDDLSLALRLHIWWPDEQNDDCVHVHNHPWDFSAQVITGAYRFQTFDISSIGDNMFAYQCISINRVGGCAMKYLGRSKMGCTFDGVLAKGSIYALPKETLHCITNIRGTLTSTLLLHGPVAGDRTQLYSKDSISNEITPYISPFGKYELVRRLERYLKEIDHPMPYADIMS